MNLNLEKSSNRSTEVLVGETTPVLARRSLMSDLRKLREEKTPMTNTSMFTGSSMLICYRS